MPYKSLKGKKIQVPSQAVKLKYKDIFDLGAFYEACFWFLREYGWRSGSGKDVSDDEGWETHYFEQHLPGGAKNITYYWRLNKAVPDTDMLHFHLDINVQIIALTSTEVIRDGNKIKANKGEIGIEIIGFIEEKYKDALDDLSWFKPFKNWFYNRVYKSTIDQRKRELYREIYVIQNFMKQWFKLKRYLPYEETKSFWPSQAWPSHHREK